MQFRSAWSRAITYGSIFGGGIAMVPVAAMLFGDVPLSGVALAGGVIVGIWGTLGFLAGFSSHSEQRLKAQTNPIAIQPSLFQRLLYRFVAGLLLSYLFAAVLGVMLAAPFVLWMLLLPDPPRGAHFEFERHVYFVAFCVYCGAQASAITSCFLGAILVPGGNTLKPIAMDSFFTSTFAVIPGAWLGLLNAAIWFNDQGLEDTGPILAAISGGLVGIGTAIAMRLGVFR